MSARVYNAVEVKQDLYDRIPGDGEFMGMMGDTVKGVGTMMLWQYDASSTATHDEVAGVIKPDLQTGNGRWLRLFNFPISGNGKRQVTVSGTTNASGNVTGTFSPAFSIAPNIQANIINGTNTQTIKITAISTTGFTVNVTNRNEVLGLLPTYSNVTGANVDILVTEK